MFLGLIWSKVKFLELCSCKLDFNSVHYYNYKKYSTIFCICVVAEFYFIRSIFFFCVLKNFRQHNFIVAKKSFTLFNPQKQIIIMSETIQQKLKFVESFTTSEVEQLKKAFEEADANHDHFLQYDEFAPLLNEYINVYFLLFPFLDLFFFIFSLLYILFNGYNRWKNKWKTCSECLMWTRMER